MKPVLNAARLALLPLAAVLILSGCATPANLMKSNDTLAENEGVLILRIHSPYSNTLITLEKLEGEGPSRVKTPEFDGGVQILVMKLPAGTYQWHKMRLGSTRLELVDAKPRVFEVVPGVLGYGGDLYIDGNRIAWRDEQPSIESYLNAIAPAVLERYPIDYAVIQE